MNVKNPFVRRISICVASILLLAAIDASACGILDSTNLGFSVDGFTYQMNQDGTFQVGANGIRFLYPDQYQASCAGLGLSYGSGDLRDAHIELWAFPAPFSPGGSGTRLIASVELGLPMYAVTYPPNPMKDSVVFVGYGASYATGPVTPSIALPQGTWYLTAFLFLDDPTGSSYTTYENFTQPLEISGGVTPPPPPSATVNPAVGLWWNPNESGSGYALDFKHGVLVVTIYSYSSTGAPQWYLTAGPLNGNVFTGTLDKYGFGQCISCGYQSPTTEGNDGTITITFSSPTSATVQLPGGRATNIEPEAF